MKSIVIIGNGFDLFHGLKTRFSDFINSDYSRLSKKYSTLSYENEEWNNIESKIKIEIKSLMEKICLYDSDEELTRIIQKYGFNESGEIDYYGYECEGFISQIEEIKDFNNLVSEFETEFREYLIRECNDVVLKSIKPYRKIFEILNSADLIISFNYTHTIEVVYGIHNVKHIHGDLNKKILIGTDTLEKEKKIETSFLPETDYKPNNKFEFQDYLMYFQEDMDLNLHINQFVQSFYNEIVTALEEEQNECDIQVDFKNKENDSYRKEITEVLKNEHYDNLIIIGHSVAENDCSVFSSVNKDIHAICYCHDERSKSVLEKRLKRIFNDLEMVYDNMLNL